MSAKVLAVNLAEVRTVRVRDRDVDTGIFKYPAEGSHAVEPLGIVGDRRIEARKFGEPNHAVHIYPFEHYATWRRELGGEPFAMGHFGENLTATGMVETRVRMGDIVRVGTAVLQVTSPRIPCRKLDLRMGHRFAGRFLRSRRTGFYLRVIEPGRVAAGDPIAWIDTDPSSPTVEAFTRTALIDYWDADGLEDLLTAKDLIEPWRERLTSKLERARSADGWFGFRDFEVVSRTVATPELVSLELRCAAGRELPRFSGGQHVTVAWRPSESEPEIRRVYALSSDPAERHRIRITVRRRRAAEPDAPDGRMSTYLCESVAEGDRLRVAAPRGGLTFGALPPACAGLTVATRGIGLAPIVSMLHDWAAAGASVPVVVFHESDDPAEPLLDELRTLEARWDGLSVHARASAAATPWAFSPRAVASHLEAQSTRAFVVGSTRFVDRVRHALLAEGVEQRRVVVESFGA